MGGPASTCSRLTGFACSDHRRWIGDGSDQVRQSAARVNLTSRQGMTPRAQPHRHRTAPTPPTPMKTRALQMRSWARASRSTAQTSGRSPRGQGKISHRLAACCPAYLLHRIVGRIGEWQAPAGVPASWRTCRPSLAAAAHHGHGLR
jgi:hypothetical protein